MKKTFRYRIYPTHNQTTTLNQTLDHKAAWAGGRVVKVNPAYTSQNCSQCGERQKLGLSERVYGCPHCGLLLNRDVNAAKNILALGMQGPGGNHGS